MYDDKIKEEEEEEKEVNTRAVTACFVSTAERIKDLLNCCFFAPLKTEEVALEVISMTEAINNLADFLRVRA